MSWLRENVLENPMMAEVSRFKQLIRGKGLSAAGVRVVILLGILLAGFIGWLIAYSDGNIEPSVCLYAQFVFCALAIPLRFYTSIAGEREKRSWELLRVAPVTNLQLTIGKFAAMGYMVLLVHALFVLPYTFAALKYGRSFSTFGRSSMAYYPYSDAHLSIGRLLTGEAYSVLVCLFIASLTLFFSARSKRSYTALALTLGAMMLIFVFGPAFGSVLMSAYGGVHFLNPFLSFGYLGAPVYNPETTGVTDSGIAASIAALCFLTFVFITYAAKTLAFADNLVKFIPTKKQSHA